MQVRKSFGVVLAVLGCGKLAVAWNDSINIWDMPLGHCTQTLKGHRGSVESLALLAEDTLASGSGDGTIKVWKPSTAACLRTMIAHTGRMTCHTMVQALAGIGEEGSLASDDGTVRAWNANGICFRLLVGPDLTAVLSLAVVSGHTIAAGYANGTIRVWDLSTGACLRALNHFRGLRTDVLVMMPNGRLVSGGQDAIVRLWDLNTGEPLLELVAHSESVYCLCVLDDGRLVSGSKDKTIRVWDTDTGACVQTLYGHEDELLDIIALPHTPQTNNNTRQKSANALRILLVNNCKAKKNHGDWASRR